MAAPEKLEWLFELVDKMSAPARAIQSSLDAVKSAMLEIPAASAQKDIDALAKASAKVKAPDVAKIAKPTEKAAKAIKEVKKKADEAKPSIDDLQKSIGAIGGGVKAMGLISLERGFGALKKRMQGALDSAQYRKAQADLGALQKHFRQLGDVAMVKEVSKFRREIRALEKLRSLPPMKRAIAQARYEFQKAGGGVRGFRSVLSMLPGPFSATVTAAGAASAALAGVGAAAAVAGVTVSKTIDSIRTKDQALLSFRHLLGGDADKAKAMFDNVVKAAKAMGAEPTQALAEFRKLLGSGLNADEAFKVFQGMADLKAINPEANVQGLIGAFGKIKASDALGLEVLLEGFRNAGVDTDKTLARLADTLGVQGATVEERVKTLRKQLQEGKKIDPNLGIAAALQSIMDVTGGPLGSAAAELGDTLGGAIDDLKNLPSTFLLQMDNSEWGNQLKGQIQGFLKLFDPESGTGKAIGKMIGAILELTSAIGGGLIDALGDVFGPLLDVIRLSDGSDGAIKRLAGGFRTLGRIIGWAVGFIALGAGAIMGLSAIIYDTGVRFVESLWGGITAGWRWMLRNFKELVELLPAPVKRILGIESGGDSTMTFEARDGSGGRPPPSLPPVNVAFPSGSLARPNQTANVGDVIVNVNGAAGDDPGAVGNAVRQSLAGGLGSAFDQLAIESGAL